MPDSFFKDPAALLEYTWDWALWLADVSDTISSATVTLSGEITAVGSPIVGDTTVIQRVTGGIVGGACSMVCQITTAGGLIDERTIDLTISER
jgi:hypothetical protein